MLPRCRHDVINHEFSSYKKISCLERFLVTSIEAWQQRFAAPPQNSGRIPYVSTRSSLSMEMSRLARDGTAEPVSRDQILRRERGQGEKIIFPVQLTTSRIGNTLPG